MRMRLYALTVGQIFLLGCAPESQPTPQADAHEPGRMSAWPHCYHLTASDVGGRRPEALGRTVELPGLFRLVSGELPTQQYGIVALQREAPGVYSGRTAVWRMVGDTLELSYRGARNDALMRLVLANDRFEGTVHTFNGRWTGATHEWIARATPVACTELLGADTAAAQRLLGISVPRAL